jgi:hypothetical protein
MTDPVESTTAQHLHDYRVNRTRGQEVQKIPRSCIECGRDATPRWLYCSDECSVASRARTTAALIAGKGRARA